MLLFIKLHDKSWYVIIGSLNKFSLQDRFHHMFP
jgi:hypothetical protein